jgi:hypothetical protein
LQTPRDELQDEQRAENEVAALATVREHKARLAEENMTYGLQIASLEEDSAAGQEELEVKRQVDNGARLVNKKNFLEV